MINVYEIEPSAVAKKCFPEKGFRYYIPMPTGRLELLELIVKKELTNESIINLYKTKVCRDVFKEKNIRPWLLRSLGALVLDGLVSISSKLNIEIIEELKKISSEKLINF